jgi:hypothetical protein
VQKLKQATIRQRDVIVGGPLFAYFLGKQKVRIKNVKGVKIKQNCVKEF